MTKYPVDFSERILLILLYAQARGNTTQEAYRFALRDWYRAATLAQNNGAPDAPSADLTEIIRHFADTEAPMRDPESIAEMIQKIVEQLKSNYSKGANAIGGSLIDKLVTVLKDKHARNVISGQTLTKLRKVLLVPDELAGLERRLQEREMSCSSCGHRFQSGEAAVILNQIDPATRTSIVNVVCTRCSKPLSAACTCPAGCDEKMPLPGKLLSYFQKSNLCQAHQDMIKNGQEVITLKKKVSGDPLGRLDGPMHLDGPEPLDDLMPPIPIPFPAGDRLRATAQRVTRNAGTRGPTRIPGIGVLEALTQTGQVDPPVIQQYNALAWGARTGRITFTNDGGDLPRGDTFTITNNDRQYMPPILEGD